MRLTKKKLDMLDTASVYSKAQHKAVCEQAIKECYEYKCIEEDLGIDLITLLKALKNGYYYRTNLAHIDKIRYADHNTIELLPYDSGWLLHVSVDTRLIDACRVEDYGKTWALTKEELE